MTSWLTQLDFCGITVVVQDWGSLIGLRVAAEQNDRFAKLFIANGFLQTGDRPANRAFGSAGVRQVLALVHCEPDGQHRHRARAVRRRARQL